MNRKAIIGGTGVYEVMEGATTQSIVTAYGDDGKAYHVPFYIVAPTTTIDFDMADGSYIEIESRDATEVTHIDGIMVAPEGMAVYNPAFDVTPNENITGIVTEKGILYPPYVEAIKRIRDIK